MPTPSIQIKPSNPRIIAPCGLDCALCRFYLRDRRPCPGCRGSNINKSNACVNCPIKNCAQLSTGGHKYCFTCAEFPCAHLRHLDHRYRKRYGVSVLANLATVKLVGVKQFLTEREARWNCPQCGSRLSMHFPECRSCGRPRDLDYS
jgi:hypothetical protein